MNGRMLLLVAAGLLPFGLLSGCGEEHHHHRPPPPAITAEPVPAGYVYYSDPYYYEGHYDQNYWYWNDREGRAHRELRDEHERHMREHPHYETQTYDRSRGYDRSQEYDRGREREQR